MTMMNLYHHLPLVVLVAVLLIITSFSSPDQCSAHKLKKKKDYIEFYDLLMDLSKKMCSKLGPLVKHRQHSEFNWRTRCDLFYDAVEETAVQMGDTMVNELDLTQKQLVDAALTPQNFYTLVSSLKQGIKDSLTDTKARIKEHDISLMVHQLLSKVILNAATMDPGVYNEMAKLPREASRNAQAQGIRMPSYGIADLDELDEENFLTGEDLQWAQRVKTGLNSEEEDEFKDEGENDGETVVVDDVEKKNTKTRNKKTHHQKKSKEENDESMQYSDEEDEKLIDDLSKEHWLLQ